MKTIGYWHNKYPLLFQLPDDALAEIQRDAMIHPDQELRAKLDDAIRQRDLLQKACDDYMKVVETLRTKLDNAGLEWKNDYEAWQRAERLREQAEAKLDASERAAAAYRVDLDRIAAWQEGDVVDGSFDEPSSAAIARHALAASDAGRDYVPRSEVDAAWRKGMTYAAVLVEALIEGEFTEDRNPIEVCRQIHRDILAARDARKVDPE